LDIFGFEDMPFNGFEQLCINFANERLHEYFLEQVIVSEKEEYQREGLHCPEVEPKVNTLLLRALTGPKGMFDVLGVATRDAIKLGAIAAGQKDEQFWILIQILNILLWLQL
jgi:hypothetical protein